MPGQGCLLAGQMRESFPEQVASELERRSRQADLCEQRTRAQAVLPGGRPEWGFAWHLGMREPGKRRESGPETLLGPESQRLRLAEELALSSGLLTRVWVGWRLTSGLPPLLWFPLNTGPCAHS